MKVRLHDGGKGEQWILDVSYIRTRTSTSIFGGYASEGCDVSIPMANRQAEIQDGTVLIISEAK